jgi:hypothetical protein
MECFDHDVEKVRVGQDEAGKLALVEPRETVVLFRRPILGLSGPGVDDEYPGVEGGPGQPRNEASVANHDSEFFEKLAGEGIDVRLALFDVASGGIPAVRRPDA